MSARTLKTINKNGIEAVLKNQILEFKWQKRVIVFKLFLECTEHKDSGKPGTSRYITTKNKKNSPDRIEIKKFNPILKKMTIHKEIK